MIKRITSAGMLFVIGAVALFFLSHADVRAEDTQQPTIKVQEETSAGAAFGGFDKALICFAAAGAVGLSCLASGFALAKIGSAALGAMSEKPELGGRALIFLGMAEGIAIYGLIIAIMMLTRV
ncbi:MAG TPA: ATP synthase subunit C [Desulfobacteraceae bacterium]|nr:ATP synthase subunit C [Desulfobacteraceae bacterium]HPJ68725.1 ATP synthase subunit C [Desulfobacteraceae bacterium]HPQ28088.1 ATP synthase subunit C [Desulfobacteraceae bacterium]